ncbi:efflux RND transporter permease subunit [Porphyromonas sp. HMSC065F10]|uniref:efflux RND transporter permease subunit n=1 Tax=Porphyromonas sp. HMSC065F10 TaxID=1739394 RepID=UPI0008A572CF|nr:efflux RND transporter permease subunit [Porphyromonas sp. HMSC065F10]OFR37974.1 acriflavin resistance protein [Porphyromonas sp. HMSC065F10]
MKIVKTSIERPIFVTVLFILLTVLGFLSFRSLSAELMPKFTPPLLNVQIIYPGASPTEVENSLTKKAEEVLSSMEGIDQMQSYSFEGMSMIMVSFDFGTDIDKAMTDAQNRLSARRAELPRDIISPMISKVSVDEKPILILSATANIGSTDLFDLIDKRVVPELSHIKGIANVGLVGGVEREIQINLDKAKMQDLGITPVMVQGAIRASNLDFPTGYLRSDESQMAVRLSGKITSIDQLRRLILRNVNGTAIRLEDVAEVVDGVKDPVKMGRVNGQEAILLNILKQSDANALDVSKAVAEQIRTLEERYVADGLRIEVAQDTTTFTRNAISSVLTDLLLAILLVSLVILLFLHNVRNALIVMVVVPVSLIASFIGMRLFGFTLNMMSLLALSLVIGVLVDDAIVVIENVYRHMEMGKNRVRATWDAMNEIGITVISVTMVLVVVFLPIIFTNSLVSDILRQFCAVIVIAILFSLLAALTLVPLLTSRLGNVQPLSRDSSIGRMLGGFEEGISRFAERISTVTRRGLSHRWTLALIVIVLMAGVMALFPLGFINFEFQPYMDRHECIIQLEMPKDISMEESNKLVRKAEDWLMRRPEVEKVVTMVGLTSDNGQSSKGTPYLAEMNVKLKEVPGGTETYVAKIRKPLSDYLVDARVRVCNVSMTGTVSKASVEYVISGTDKDSVALYADKALSALSTIPGVIQPWLSVENATPEVTVHVDRDKMSNLGLTLDNVGMMMQTSFQGNDQLRYTEGDYEYAINIRADKVSRRSIEDVAGLMVVNGQGDLIRLSQFADVSLGIGPSRLERYNRNSSVTLRAQAYGVPAGAIAKEFMSRLDGEDLPGGVQIQTTGDMKKMSDSMSVLMMAILLSLLFIYLALTLLYNNWTDPLVVMIAIPLSIVGALLALALTNTAMSIYAMLGMVMLVGLVAKNAILLVDFANEARTEGLSVDEALIQAVKLRTRPILMTALSTIIGMLPVALSHGSGAELRTGMAWVIIGGMALSTLLTLIVVPALYKAFHARQRSGTRQKVDIEALLTE